MRRSIVVLFAVLLLCIIAVSVFAGGDKDAPKPSKAVKVEVTGTVRLVGNEPFTMLVLSGENRNWFIEPKEEVKLADYQQQTITVTAKEYYYDMTFANGMSAGRRYYLKGIKVVAVNNEQEKSEEVSSEQETMNNEQ